MLPITNNVLSCISSRALLARHSQLTFLKPACLCTVLLCCCSPRVGRTFSRSQTSMQTRATYNKPVQFPPSSLTSAKEHFLWLLYITTWPHSCIFFHPSSFGLPSWSLPVRRFLCVRWVLSVICMHVLSPVPPYSVHFLSMMHLLLGLYYSLLSLHYALRLVELPGQRMHWNSSLCPPRSSDL